MKASSQVPTAELLETLKRHGIQNTFAYRMLLSLTVDPDKDMLEDFWNVTMPTISHNKLFTSPFPKQGRDIDGEFRFAVSENQLPAGLNSDEVHTLLVGASGTGKTICQELIALSFMRKGHTAWLFVKADDVTRMPRAYRNILYVNPAGSECELRLNLLRVLSKETFITLFKDAFTLADGSEGHLLQTLGELQRRNPDANVSDLYHFIKARKHPLWSRECRYQESILNRTAGLLESPLGKLFDCARGHEESIQHCNVIFNIGQLTLPQQKFFVGLLVHTLMKATKMRLLGFDDAALLSQIMQNRELSFLDDLFSSVRKYDIHLMLATQIPETLSPGIIANCANRIVFRLDSGIGIEAMQRHMNVIESSQKSHFYKLNQKEHEVIVEFTKRGSPFVAKIIKVDLPLKMSEQELRQNNERLMQGFSRVIPRTRTSEVPTASQQQGNPEELNPDEKDFLELAFHCFDSPLTELYRRREWGIQKGDAVVNALERKGYVVKVRLNPSGKRGGLSVFLFHTDKYYSLTGKQKPISGTDGKGPEHNILIRLLQKNLKEVKKCNSIEIGRAFDGARTDLYFRHADAGYVVEACSSTLKTEKEKIAKILKNPDVKSAFVVANKLELVKALKEELKGLEHVVVLKFSEFLNTEIDGRAD